MAGPTQKVFSYAAALLVLTSVACGKRGEPKPPVPVIPQATSDLVVTQRGSKVILSWTYPAFSTAGQGLQNVSRVVVYRLGQELPATVAGREPVAGQEGATDRGEARLLTPFQGVPIATPQQFSRTKEKLDSIEGAALEASTGGSRLFYEDEPPPRTPDGRPIRWTYAVVTEAKATPSDLSNLATLVPLEVPPAPSGLVSRPSAEGVNLTWSAPQAPAAGVLPSFAGYNIYRFPSEGEIVELGMPVNPSPLEETSYRDAPAYGTYRYAVTAVVTTGPPRVESDATGTIAAEFRDLVAPPNPTEINTLAEVRTVRLVWNAVEAADLQGYKVYRVRGSQRTSLTPSPVPDTFFVDSGATAGETYTYVVTTVDTNGNESAGGSSPQVMIPR